MQLEKNRMRQEIKKLLVAMDAESRHEASQQAIKRVCASGMWQQASVIGLFAGLRDEVDTSFFWTQDSTRGKQICYPKIVGEAMIFLETRSLSCLTKDIQSFPEPTGPNVLQPDLLIVPGMAFDPCGWRLGRGRGYYDRFLAEKKGVMTIGLCFDFQILENIPTEPHDVPMKALATNKSFQVIR